MRSPWFAQEERLVFLIDGFDEMRDHESTAVDRYFETLVKLSKKHSSPLVLAMRSTIVSNQIRQQWKNNDVLVVKVDEFDDEDVDAWAAKWRHIRGVEDVTGDSLRSLCGNLRELIRNPLLLFMLARYVQPVAEGRGSVLTRTEIFRTFVDETIAGKARRSGETAGVRVDQSHYRLLLQEIAWTASWPNHGGKCPLAVIRERIGNQLDELQISNLRSAFVLHFFEPGDHFDEFEFHPEGFRHYLLAEWCVRTQIEALLYDDNHPSYPTGRKRQHAINALAQFPLREIERELINELYEQLPAIIDTHSHRASSSRAFCVEKTVNCNALFERLRGHANDPPSHNWESDSRIGVHEGYASIDALQPVRLLTNYWDQSLLATFGLFRGLRIDSAAISIFGLNSKDAFQRFRSCVTACQPMEFDWSSHFIWNSLGLQGLRCTGGGFDNAAFRGSDLDSAMFVNAIMQSADFRTCRLVSSNFTRAFLPNANFSGSELAQSSFRVSSLRQSKFVYAKLNGADFWRADLAGADLSEANLAEANVQGADLTEANLTKAILTRLNWSRRFRGGALESGNFTRANLTEANLTEAKLTKANLTEANLTKARLTEAKLTEAKLTEAKLTEAKLTKAKLTEAKLTEAKLTKANLTGANLTGANLTGANLTGANLTDANLEDANLEDTCMDGVIGFDGQV